MAEQVNGIGLDVDNGLFEVGATLPQAGSWSIGCDVTIEDVDASVQEVRVNDISLSGSLAIPEVSVNIDANNDKVMDLEIGIAASGLSTGITESQIVPYDKIVKITEFSPESINERKYASSALAAKRIYDLINKGGAGLNEDELKDFLKRYGYVTEEYVNDILKAATNFFYLSEDGQSIGTPYNIFSEKEISANGLSVGSGGSGGGEGGGLIRNVLSSSSLGSVTSNDNFTTFNAFAIDSIYKKVKSIEEGNVSLSNYYTKSESDAKFALASSLTTVEGKIKEILTWFTIDENGNLRTELNLYSTKEISAGGLSASGGSTGGGLISTVLGIEKFGTVTTNSNTATFNAYAIDSLHKRIKSIEESEVDLTGYATEAWVAGQGFITSAALSPYMKTADANDTFATKTALNNLSSNHDSLAARVSTAEGNISANATAITNLGKRVTANEGNIAEILKWFAEDSEGNLCTTYNFYSTKEISSNGLSIGTGGSGGGLISQVYGTTAFGTIASESNSATFNAYAIDSLYKRIVSLEGKATAVSFVPALTSGKMIGTLSIDGVSTVLYGVDAYSKADADGTFLKLSGGTIVGNGALKLEGSGFSFAEYYSGSTLLGRIGYSGVDVPAVRLADGWYEILHANNYSQYALPLTGGTISGGVGALSIKRTSSNAVSLVKYENNDGALGYLGISKDKKPIWYNQDLSDFGYLYHSGNFNPANYLPLSGGKRTITSTDNTSLVLKTDGYHSLIQLDNNHGNSVSFGYYSGRGAEMQNGSNYLAIKDDGTPVYNTNTLIHSGNIGSQNAGGLVGQYVLDINNASANKVFSSGFQPANRPSENYATGWTLCNDDLKYTYQLAYNTSGILYSRYKNTSAWSDWKTVAFTDSNVASATKLATARTIWGQSFDGTGNVTGNLKVGDGYLYLNNNKGLYSYGTDGVASYIAGLDSSNNYLFGHGQYAATLRGKTISLAYGTSHTTGLILNASGNVGIGTTSPAYKLDVNGRIKSLYSSTNTILSNGVYSYNVNNGGFVLYAGVSSTNALRIEILDNTGAWKCGAMSFDYSGNVGIGTHAPEHKLHVTGNVAAIATDTTPRSFRAINSNGTISLLSSTSRGVYDSTNSRWLIGTDGTNSFLLCGNVGIGKTNPAYKLDVDGTARVTGAVTMSSTLHVVGVSTFESYLNIQAGIRPNTDNARYVGTSSYRFNEGYINNMYTNAMYVGKGMTYGFKSDGSINATAITANSGVKVASGQALTFLDASGKEHKLTYDSTAGAFKFDGSVYATEEVSALGLSSSVSSEYLGYNLLLSDVNGADMAVKHGTTISAQTAATLNFKRIIPTDIDRACIIYIIKAASSNLSVPVVATSGIRMVNSSGAVATATATVSGVAGIMLIWDNASACWRGSVI